MIIALQTEIRDIHNIDTDSLHDTADTDLDDSVNAVEIDSSNLEQNNRINFLIGHWLEF